MSNIITKTQIKSVTFEGVVVKCGCTDAEKVKRDWHGWYHQVCPKPKEINDLGIIAYRSNNPFKNIWWKLRQYFK